MQTLISRAFDDTHFFVQIFADFVQLHLFDFQRTLIFFHAVTGEDLYVDNGTGSTGLNAQRRIFYVRGFFTEDRTQQFFFRSQLGFTLRCYLTHQNIARLNFSTDINDTGFIQFTQCGFAHVRNIRGDFFRTQLGVTRHTGQFLNVDSGQAIFLRHSLGQQDGVFVVVTVPRHEGDAEVLAQSQFTQVNGRTVSHDVAAFNAVTGFYQWTLVNTGVLVRTGVFGQVIDVDTGFTSDGFVIVHFYHDTGSINGVDNTTTIRHHTHTGVSRDRAFHTSTHQRLL